MSPRPKQTDSTQGYCPTPQNSPTHIQMNSTAAAVPAKPHRKQNPRESSQTREKYPVDMASMS